MNKAYFIAKKIFKDENEDKKVSRPIVKIAQLSIILAMIVNVITVAVVIGFQNQVKEKIIGFGAHATIIKSGEINAFETLPIQHSEALIDHLYQLNSLKNIAKYAYKPALFQTQADTTFFKLANIDTFQVQQQIKGVVVKGVDENYNFSFFEDKLVEGIIPNFSLDKKEMLISSKVANSLGISLDDELNVFFVKSQPIKDKYKIVGIYETGLDLFDDQIVFTSLSKVQNYNDWGIKTELRVADTLTDEGQFVIYADARGGNGNYRYDWGEGYETNKGITFCNSRDTTIKVIVSDFWMFVDGYGEKTTIPDTAYIKITVQGNVHAPCFNKNGKKIKWEYLNETGTKIKTILANEKSVIFEYIDGKGSAHNYIGGYEVFFKDFDNLDQLTDELAYHIADFNDDLIYDLDIRTIKEQQSEIFLWLDFLDINVWIILILMVLVSTINMGAGLLVLIITKTSFIGLLKAIGTNNWTIRKVFLYQATFIVLRAMFWGNIIGFGLAFLQDKFGLIKLNAEVYYLNAVPIELSFTYFVLLNVGTFLLCISALLIPSYVITRISVVKAIKFN